jgi:signal transduction histidine kinase
VRLPALRVWPDLLPAIALLVLGEAELAAADPSEPRWLIALITAALTAPLALRRYAPLAVLVWTVAAAIALAALEPDLSQVAIPLSLLLAIFSVGFELDARRALLGFGLVFAAFGVATVAAGLPIEDLVLGTVLYGVAWAAGRGLRGRTRQVDALSERAARLERDREQQERAAVAAERARIARELHDIVSHSISVVVLQTQAVRRRLRQEQQSERDDLEAVEATARQALAEMRRLFGVLRADGDPPSLEPQPGLDQLERLLAEVRAAGLAAELTVEGARVPLPPGVDLAAFRIVQEALTNVRKHAPSAHASVFVRFDERRLEIAVRDDGPGEIANGRPPGHGLIGMRERVALYGGSLETGRAPGGGFQVSATLPIREGSRG